MAATRGRTGGGRAPSARRFGPAGPRGHGAARASPPLGRRRPRLSLRAAPAVSAPLSGRGAGVDLSPPRAAQSQAGSHAGAGAARRGRPGGVGAGGILQAAVRRCRGPCAGCGRAGRCAVSAGAGGRGRGGARGRGLQGPGAWSSLTAGPAAASGRKWRRRRRRRAAPGGLGCDARAREGSDGSRRPAAPRAAGEAGPRRRFVSGRGSARPALRPGGRRGGAGRRRGLRGCAPPPPWRPPAWPLRGLCAASGSGWGCGSGFDRSRCRTHCAGRAAAAAVPADPAGAGGCGAAAAAVLRAGSASPRGAGQDGRIVPGSWRVAGSGSGGAWPRPSSIPAPRLRWFCARTCGRCPGACPGARHLRQSGCLRLRQICAHDLQRPLPRLCPQTPHTRSVCLARSRAGAEVSGQGVEKVMLEKPE